MFSSVSEELLHLIHEVLVNVLISRSLAMNLLWRYDLHKRYLSPFSFSNRDRFCYIWKSFYRNCLPARHIFHRNSQWNSFDWASLLPSLEFIGFGNTVCSNNGISSPPYSEEGIESPWCRTENLTLPVRRVGGNFTGRLFGSALLVDGARSFDVFANMISATGRSVLELAFLRSNDFLGKHTVCILPKCP